MKLENKFNFEDEKAPPYGYLIGHIDELRQEVPGISNNLLTCHQCEGTGYDSDERAASCCSCYVMGKIFSKDGIQPVNYKEQREFVMEMVKKLHGKK